MKSRFILKLLLLLSLIPLVGSFGCSSQKAFTKDGEAIVSDAVLVFREGANLLYVDNVLALEKFNLAKSMDEQFLPAFYNAGVASALLSLNEDAVRNYEACLMLNPTEQSCLINLMELKYSLGDKEYSQKMVEEKLAAHQNEPFANVLAGNYYLLEKDWSLVEKYARLAIEYQAENVEALFLMVRFFIEQKRYSAARFAGKNALNVAPSHGGLHLYMGHAFLAENLTNDALESYQKAVRYKPSEEALESYAKLLAQMGKVKESIPIFNRLVSLNQSNAINWLLLGNALASVKDFFAAKDAFEKTLEIAPENIQAKFNLGLLFLDSKPEGLSELERLTTAEKYFKDFLAQNADLNKTKEVKGYLESIAEKIEIEKSYSDSDESEGGPEEEVQEEELAPRDEEESLEEGMPKAGHEQDVNKNQDQESNPLVTKTPVGVGGVETSEVNSDTPEIEPQNQNSQNLQEERASDSEKDIDEEDEDEEDGEDEEEDEDLDEEESEDE